MKRPIARGLILVAAAGLLAFCTAYGAEDPKPAGTYAVTRTLKVGGEGGWDYATLDDAGKLLYLPRTTHALIVDTATGKTVADVGTAKRAHGVALVPDAGRGFITDGEAGSVTVFDLKTHEVLGTVAAADDADGVIYDAASNHVFVSCGDANALVAIAPDVDPKSGKAAASIPLGGKPEFLAADGKGMVYVALVDKNQVAVVDAKAMKVVTKWPTAPGTGPVGMSMDRTGGRLYVGCRNQKMIVLNAKDGSVLADLPIGRGVDATGYHEGTAFASCSDGTLTVIRETSPGKFEVAQTVATAAGSRTMAVDAHTGAVYLPAADMSPAPAGGRPKPVAGSFKVLVVEEAKKN